MNKSKESLDISKYYLPAAVLVILLVAALVLLPAPQLSATEKSKLAVNELGSPIKSVELTGLEYSILSKIGIGSVTYTVTYNDNTFIYRIVKGTLSMGYINTFPMVSDVPAGGLAGDGKLDVLLYLGGVSCSLSGSSASNQHTYLFAYDALMQTKFFTSIKTIPCGLTNDAFKFTLSGWGTKNAINVPGTYRIYVQDRIMLPSGTIVTDQNWFDMKVIGTATPPPLPPTPPPTTASSIRVTSNIPSSVYIDGTGVGVSGGTFPVDAGGHDIKVVQSGYTPFMKSVTVDYGALVTVSATLNKIMITPPLPPTPPPVVTTVPPVVTTVPPVVTTVPPVGTPVVTTIPGQTTPAPTSTSGSGGMVVETEQPTGGATVTYENESLLNSTNILIAFLILLSGYILYNTLYVKKGSKGRKGK